MKNLLIMGSLLLSMNSYAGNEKGNGGSSTEARLVGQQAQLEGVALKIRSFFLKNESTLKPVFPEFNIQELAKKIKYSEIKVVEKDKLIDKHGKSRTCLNYSKSALIECKSIDVEPLFDNPTALFVLVLHEYLGLIEVEETSPKNVTMIDGYSISKRIAPFVSKVNDYDLVLPKKVEIIEENLAAWPDTIDSANSLSKCFMVYNDLYNDYVKQKRDLEFELMDLNSTGSNVSEQLNLSAKILNLSSKLKLMDMKLDAVSISNQNNANEKFHSYKLFCINYGVELVRE